MIHFKEAFFRVAFRNSKVRKIHSTTSYLQQTITKSIIADTYQEKAKEYCREFIAPVENEKFMKNIMKAMVDQLNLACFNESKHLSSLVTTNTFMQDFATGSEKGQYLSLLIGENNLEIMIISINNELVKRSDKKVLKLTSFQKQVYTTDMLVALVAEFVIDYVREDIPLNELEGRTPTVVITYEMPLWLDRTSLKKGLIVRSSMGNLLPRSEQHDLIELLTSMLKSWGHNFEIKCLMNFGSACFHDKQWTLRETIGSIVLDRSISICHLEYTDKIKGFDESNIDRSKPRILMSTDLTEFGYNKELASITTEFDVEIDQHSSLHPGKKIFRKFISETYMGELFRLMLVKMIKDGLLLDSELTYQIRRPFCILCEELAYFENWMNNEKNCENVLKYKLGYDSYGLADLMILSYLADVVMDRSTRISALALAALAERSKEKRISFAFTGNLVLKHRLVRNRLSDYVRFYSRHTEKNVRVVKASSESVLRGASLFASRI